MRGEPERAGVRPPAQPGPYSCPRQATCRCKGLVLKSFFSIFYYLTIGVGQKLGLYTFEKSLQFQFY